MTLSMNEIEATAKKAVRGAGYPWGLAEEAAKATRWLCARDVDACTELANLLEDVDGKKIIDWTPVPTGNRWNSPGGPLCPLATGAALSDRANEIASADIRLEEIAHPVLLAPFAAFIAQQIDDTVMLKCDGTEFVTDGHDFSQRGNIQETATEATIGTGGKLGTPNRRRDRADPPASSWETLCRFAHRTYAPATDESRLRGAGAGNSDND